MRFTKLKPADETLNGNEPGALRVREPLIVLVLVLVVVLVLDSALIARQHRERS
jgi:hypothetical protein